MYVSLSRLTRPTVVVIAPMWVRLKSLTYKRIVSHAGFSLHASVGSFRYNLDGLFVVQEEHQRRTDQGESDHIHKHALQHTHQVR